MLPVLLRVRGLDFCREKGEEKLTKKLANELTVILTLSLSEYSLKFVNVVVTFEPVDEILK